MSSNNTLPEEDGEICTRLLSACNGHPHALIPWPHRLLHDAVAHISDLTRRLAEAEKSAWEECHAMSSRLSKANQESNMWRNCAVYLDYRGADYCVAIHKELDGLQEDNRKHREQVSKLLAEWKRRAEAAEARVRELREALETLLGSLCETPDGRSSVLRHVPMAMEIARAALAATEVKP